jgi:hypothetical protein
MHDVRPPAVASMFYPDDRINLTRMINGFLSEVPDENREFFQKNRVDHLFGLISPHAGYVYSGPVAAHAYDLLRGRSVDTVILIGPSHFTHFAGFSLPFFKAFETPLGEVELDEPFIHKLLEDGGGVFDTIHSAHIKEHSLEVQLPFLQEVLEDFPFKIVPVLMGEQTWQSVHKGAEVLSEILKIDDKHFLIVVSTDLSHYHTDAEAREMDAKTIQFFENLDAQALMRGMHTGEIEACGMGPVAVLLETARILGYTNFRTLDYRTSGDSSGDLSRVVGYVSAALW